MSPTTHCPNLTATSLDWLYIGAELSSVRCDRMMKSLSIYLKLPLSKVFFTLYGLFLLCATLKSAPMRSTALASPRATQTAG